MSALEGLLSPFEVRSRLTLRCVAIDGEVAARLKSYETALAQIACQGLRAGAMANYVSQDFDAGTRTIPQLQAAAYADLRFLLQAVNDKRAADEATAPEYLR